MVIPTLWRFLPFFEFVNEVANIEVIDKVIVVDNARSLRPNIDFNTKIQFLDFGQNIFVNPAWNVGAYHSTGDIICFQNDDVLFDCNLFYHVAQKMKSYHGLWGYNESPIGDNINFLPYSQGSTTGFGQLFFINRKHFVDIPNDLLVHCGDLFLFEIINATVGNMVLIENLNFYTPKQVSSHLFEHLYIKTCIDYQKIMSERSWLLKSRSLGPIV